MRETWRALASGLTAVWLAGGCGGERRDAATAVDSAEVAASVPAAPAAPRLGEAEVVHVMTTANGIVVRAAEQARTRARTPAVVAFARTLVADHSAVNARIATLARELDLMQVDNAVSRRLEEEAAAAAEELTGLDVSAYEEAYIAREAVYHEMLLEMLDNPLIPAAQNERLRTLLEAVRPAFAAHLQRALQIRPQLGATSTAVDTASGGT